MKKIFKKAMIYLETISLCFGLFAIPTFAESEKINQAYERGEMVEDFLERRELEQEEFEIILTEYTPEMIENFNKLYDTHEVMHIKLGEVKRAMLQKAENDYDSSLGISFNEFRVQQEAAFELTIADIIAAEEVNENEGRILRKELSIALKQNNTVEVKNIIYSMYACLSSHIYDYDHGKLKASYDFLEWEHPVHTWLL